MDEMTCLNLTISAPRDALGEKGKALPVMVYVHGGGFTEGSGHISALHGKLAFGWRIKRSLETRYDEIGGVINQKRPSCRHC
jgi:hypothetical protein